MPTLIRMVRCSTPRRPCWTRGRPMKERRCTCRSSPLRWCTAELGGFCRGCEAPAKGSSLGRPTMARFSGLRRSTRSRHDRCSRMSEGRRARRPRPERGWRRSLDAARTAGACPTRPRVEHGDRRAARTLLTAAASDDPAEPPAGFDDLGRLAVRGTRATTAAASASRSSGSSGRCHDSGFGEGNVGSDGPAIVGRCVPPPDRRLDRARAPPAEPAPDLLRGIGKPRSRSSRHSRMAFSQPWA